MQPQRRSAVRLLLVGLAAGACTEQTPPTAIPNGVNAAVTAAAGSNNSRVKVKTMQLSSNTLRINGPSVSGQVTIGNTGEAITGGVRVRAEITQGAVTKQAVNTPTQCSPAAADAGKLPTNNCDMTFTAAASNSTPVSGTLVAGPATFILHVVQTSDAGDTELASKSLLVNLVATPSMAVTLAPTTLLIGLGAATATAVIQNPANSLQGVLLQGWIVQGVAPNQTRRAAGGTLVTCGSNAGVLPPGTCTMTVSASASNSGSGNGTLVAGAATFELDLIRSSGGVSTTFDVETVAITLAVQGPPTITSITIDPYVVIGSGSTSYTAFLQNNGPVVSTVVLQAWISQGTTRQAAGGRQVQCNGGPIGVLPTGTCILLADVVAASGALVPGPATLEIDLDRQGGATTNFDKKFIPITLVASTPSIVSIDLAAPNVLIGESIEYTATLYNPTGATISSAGIQGYLSQGSIVDFGAGGTDLTCASQAELPRGVCKVTFTLNTRNIDGAPAWQPGAATFRLELTAGATLLDSKSVTVFLNIIQ